MDSNNESTSMTNSAKQEGDEKNKNIKGTPRQAGQGDNEDKVSYQTATQSSSFVPLNGSRSVLGSGSNYGDTPSQSGTSSECYRGRGSNVTVNKVNSTDGISINESATASSSRSSLNTNNGLDYIDVQPSRYKPTPDKAGSSTAPSTSGTSRGSDNDVFVNKENRKRPSSLKLNRPNIDDDSSSDTGNDDYSLGSEDGCIYTYRGGEHLADLPSSFFSLDMGLPLDRHLPMPNYPVQQQGGANQRGSRASSPDMDFLEMDFDPGPSCEVDTGDESTPDADLDIANNMPEEIQPVVVRGTSPEYSVTARFNPVPPNVPTWHQEEHTCSNQHAYSSLHNQPSTSQAITSTSNTDTTQHMYGPYITHVNTRGEQLLVRRTMSHWVAPANMHMLNGDLVAQRDNNNCPEELPDGSFAYATNRGRVTYDVNPAVTPSTMYHVAMVKKLMAEKSKTEESASSAVPPDTSEPVAGSSTSTISCVEPPRCMVWSEKEACERQVTQIGVSACGATAVVNVFNALGVPVNIERINASVGTRLRANSAPLPRYLLSRAVAGCTAADLVAGLQRASEGLVTARFFPTYPERAMALSHWLADWISLGAVPILTLNLQHGCEGDIPDAWHHQMVFGVSPQGVYLCNPVECVRERALWPRLAAPSVLLVRARDVVARFTPTTDLTPLMHVPDVRWHTQNVLGQVANVLREWRAAGWQAGGARTRHVALPAAYRAGVTVAALTGSEAHRRLVAAPPPPVLHPAPHPDPHPAPHADPHPAPHPDPQGGPQDPS